MKIKISFFYWILFGVGIFTFYYLFLSLRDSYSWTLIAHGFGGLYLVLITAVSGILCLLGTASYLITTIKKTPPPKPSKMYPTIHCVLAIGWLGFLQGLSLSMDSKIEKIPNDVLPDTKWVELDQKMLYTLRDTKSGESTLYSIDVNGNNRKEIIGKCRQFGWLPNGKDLFVISDTTLFLLRNSGETKEEICNFSYYTEKEGVKNFGRPPHKFCNVAIEWSPKGNLVAFTEKDEDTNGDGKLDWKDVPNLYIFDLTSQTKQRINYDRQNSYFEQLLWNKSGDQLYFVYLKTLSPNELKYYLCSYNVTNREINQLKESKYDIIKNKDISLGLIVHHAGKENLFYTQKYPAQVKINTTELEPRNSVEVFYQIDTHYQYIQKGEEAPRRVPPGVFHGGNFFWLPNGRYVIFRRGVYLSIWDIETDKVGILTKGEIPAWYEEDVNHYVGKRKRIVWE